jgi:protein phosphatase
MLDIEYAGLTDLGRVRKKNEDAWVAVPEMGLFIVSDGIGGNFAGELASKIVVEALPKLLRRRLATSTNLYKELTDDDVNERIRNAICELSNDLCSKTANEPGLEGMGATLVMGLIRGDNIHIAHMGDSRAYLHRNSQLKQITIDHSLVQLLIDNEEIKPEEAATHPARGQLTRSVGMVGEPLPEAKSLSLQTGDRLLLCSDGLTGMVSDEDLLRLVSKDTGALQDVCGQLIKVANEAGGTDNITVFLIDIGASKASETTQVMDTEA